MRECFEVFVALNSFDSISCMTTGSGNGSTDAAAIAGGTTGTYGGGAPGDYQTTGSNVNAGDVCPC